MWGELAWMDTLSQQFFGAWKIEAHPKNGAPYLREITEEEIVKPIPEVVLHQIQKERPTEVLKKAEAVQQSLF